MRHLVQSSAIIFQIKDRHISCHMLVAAINPSSEDWPRCIRIVHWVFYRLFEEVSSLLHLHQASIDWIHLMDEMKILGSQARLTAAADVLLESAFWNHLSIRWGTLKQTHWHSQWCLHRLQFQSSLPIQFYASTVCHWLFRHYSHQNISQEWFHHCDISKEHENPCFLKIRSLLL